ncbi:MAG: redox-regulated ATPase YchF [Deltaproteobacteria bacterium]|nr:redox-regulated ATPase YchF [Deltaproteobacteria bacterium]
MKAAIIGLAQSGKTTLFHALAGTSREKGGLTMGTVEVPDPRVDKLTEMYRPKKTIHAALDIVEAHAPSLGGKDKAQGLDPAFLNMVKPMDAFLLVVRAFDGEGLCDPARDVRTVLDDLVLADQMVIENRLERMDLDVRKGKPPAPAEERKALERALELLNDGNLILNDPQLASQHVLRGYAFLTARPILTVVNIAEGQVQNDPATIIESWGLPVKGLPTFPCCAGLEKEIHDLPVQERGEFLEAMGIGEPVLDVVVRRTYAALGLISFLTVGPDEVRAWTIRDGTKAPAGAGTVHSDIERGFIRAEVMSYDDLAELGSEAAVKKAGKARLEGKDYVIRDGDVINFRFNV